MKSITTQNESLEAARSRNITDALAEDIGTGDWTAQLGAANKPAHAKLIVRQSAVLCGIAWFEGVIHALDSKAVITWQYAEGDTMRADS
jgi:nicotinate-nucleotide pyrophosphorylase (carboxylating)